MERKTVAVLLGEGASVLPRREGIPNPRREALWLLARAWGKDETAVRLDPGARVPDPVAARYLEWIERRRAGEPAHHLTGSCSFWGREFLVSPAVLIPRPETELLVEAALAWEPLSSDRVLDVGTGSGCLAVTLAAERSAWNVTATDRSLPALEIAATNARRHGAWVGFLCGDLASGVRGGVGLVVANLPYIPTRELAGLPVEVRHDPPQALDGGADGLTLILRLIADLPGLLAPEGLALLEVGPGQMEPVHRAALRVGLEPLPPVLDLGGVARVLRLRRPSAV